MKTRCNSQTYVLVSVVMLGAWLAAAPPARSAPAELLSLENAFAQVADTAFPAVVVITNKQVSRQAQSPMYPFMPPEFRRFFGIPETPPQSPQRQPRDVPRAAGKGSGVIISADGLIVTNYHVIRDHDELEVRLHDGRVFATGRDGGGVTVVGSDPETDLAVLRIGNGSLSDLPVLKFADSDQVRVGQWAIAVGAPFDMDYTITVGVVSQMGRHGVRMNTYENYIQTDAAINPGNSGGPLLNISGQIIGISNFIVTGGGMSRGSIGLGFAISSNLVGQVVNNLLEHGKVVRPWLGIAMQPFTEELREQFGVDSGVLVSEVFAGDPAAQAGVKPGDVIVEVGQTPVRSPHDVQFAVLKYSPGETFVLKVNRNGEVLELQVTARRKDGQQGSPAEPESRNRFEKLGLVLEADDDGVVIADVAAGSAASAAQLQPGDRILEINRQELSSLAQAAEAFAAASGNSAILYIDRGGRKLFVPIRLDRQLSGAER